MLERNLPRSTIAVGSSGYSIMYIINVLGNLTIK